MGRWGAGQNRQALRSGSQLVYGFFSALWLPFTEYATVIGHSRKRQEPNMQTDFSRTVQMGMNYCKTWPMQPELAMLFPDNRLIRLTQLLKHWMPAAAVISCCVQLQYSGMAQFWLAVSWALLLLTLPVQALFLLGQRAATPLPPHLNGWYKQIRQQMQQAGVDTPQPAQRPVFQDLAVVLRSAYQQLDRAFVNQLI